MKDTDFLVKWTICTNKLLGRRMISTFAFKLEAQTHKHTHSHARAHISMLLEALSPFRSRFKCVCASTIFHSHFNYIMCVNKGKVKFYSRRWKSSEWRARDEVNETMVKTSTHVKWSPHTHKHTHSLQIFVKSRCLHYLLIFWITSVQNEVAGQ